MNKTFQKKWFKIILLSFVWLLIVGFALFISLDSSDFFYLAIALVINLVITLIFYPNLFSAKYIFALPVLFKKKSQNSGLKGIELSETRKKKLKLKKKILVVQTIFFAIFTTLFFYLLVYKFDSSVDKNFILGYFFELFEFTRNNKMLLFVPTIPFVLSIIFNKTHIRPKNFFISLIVTSTNVLFSAFIALLLGLVASFIETSLLKYQVSNNPNSINLYTNVEDILDILNNFNNPPNIVGNDKDIEEIVITSKLKRKSNFFKGEIIPLVAELTPFDMKLDGYSVFLIDKTLAVRKLDKDKMEVISPTVGKLFLEKTLAPNYIKKEPKLYLMSRQEYLKYRDEQINQAIEAIDNTLAEIQNSISALYSTVQNDKNMIAFNENSLNESISQRDADYEYCMNAGYYSYYFNTFYRYYTDSYCENQKQEWDNVIDGFRKNIEDWKDQLTYNQNQLNDFQEYKTLFEDYRSLVALQKESTVYELGLFEPDDLVKVVLENTDSASLADFYTTLVHEYLHYTSYVSEERQLGGFFEEGLTEYFARKTIKDNLNVETNIGYPLITNIIFEMVKKVPEDKLEEIYFTKDHNALVELLNQTYGDNFYEESELYFAIIYYVPTKDALKIANNILFKIGGEKLSEEGLVSTYSEFD